MAGMLVMQWARAEAEPTMRASLSRRRDQIAAAGEMLMREGIATGELPSWTDAPALAAAYVTFLDGLLLWSLEQGAPIAARRRSAGRSRCCARSSPRRPPRGAGRAARPPEPGASPRPRRSPACPRGPVRGDRRGLLVLDVVAQGVVVGQGERARPVAADA